MHAFVAALDELLALSGRIGDDKATAVQHADELLQLFRANCLRRKIALEALGNFVEARLAVEHLQDGEFFFLKTVVLQPDGVLDHPIKPALVTMLTSAQVRPLANRQLPRRTGYEAF